MPKKESIQEKLGRVRPPRVHIKYEVEIGDAIELKELPFVVGVLGDFSGKPVNPLPPVRDRKFVEIDRDNFNQVMLGMAPRLAYRVDNKLDNAGTKMNVELRFKSLEDFEPDNVVQQVEPLRHLVAARRRLADLLSKMDGNDRLDELLQEVIQNTGAQKQLSEALGLESPVAGVATKEEPNE
jgi:type VI secretion system protein ImpB